MGEIEIIKRKGGTIRLFSRDPFCTVKSATQNISLMGDDEIQLSIISTELLAFEKGDKIIVGGEEYTFRTRVSREMKSDRYYQYDVVFYGVMYELMKAQYRNTDESGKSTSMTFDLTYSIRDFVKVIIYNMNRDYPGLWAFDEANCPDTEPRTISFSRQNCLQVLQSLCSKDNFKLEFRITQDNGVRTIHIGKFGTNVIPPSGSDYFEWGKGGGLYTLKDQNVDDKAIITRLWVEGGTTNIRSDYRNYSERLQLPYPKRMNKNEHTLADGTVIPANSEMIGIDDDTRRYIEDAELAREIGSEEDSEQYDDIFPKRTGVVTAIVEDDINSFIDDTMDFDLNEKDGNGTRYLINDVTAKITFITGRLAGQQFELKKEGGYDHSAKRFTIIPFTDNRGLTFPTTGSDAFRVEVGNKYKITDINLPKSYEDNAEEDLWYAGYDDFKPRTQSRVQYALTFDRSYFLENMPADSETSVFKVGDYVPVRDVRFGVEKSIRIQNISRNLLLEHDYSLTLSDTTTVSVLQQTVTDVIEHDRIIETNRLKDLSKARRGWRTTEELRNMVYDTDGYFDPENIRPNSIDTNMLTVGSKSQQFVLIGVVMQANVNGNANRFDASSGILAHLTIDETTIKQWTLGELSVVLSEQGGYYVFAKCSKTGTNGVFVVTQTPYRFEPTEDPNNYYFQIGIISSLYPDDNFRDFVTTYGFTRINGKTITTGTIVTSDGECYLDLDGNKFRIGDATSSIDWNVTRKGQLTLHNVRLLSDSGDVSFIGVYRGAYNGEYVYYKGDEVSYSNGSGTCTYRYIYPTPASGIIPTNTTYWEVVSKGQNGDDGLPGEKGEDGKTTYLHIKYSDDGGLSFTANNGEEPGAYIGQYVDFIQKDSDNPADYTWSSSKGESGAAGSDATTGEYYEYRYAKNGSTVTPPDLDAGAVNPEGWTTTMPTVGDLEYLWCTIAKKSGLSDKKVFDIPVHQEETTLTDISGHGISGTLGKGASVVQDGDRYAVDLSDNAECQINRDLPFGKSFTLCFWMKTDQTLIRWMLNGYNGRDYVEKNLTVSKNTWFHVALRFNDRTVSIFINGSLVQTDSINEEVVGFSMYDDNMFGSSVLFDDVRMYDGALSATDIEKDKSGACDQLVQNWSTPVRINGKDGEKGESPAAVYQGAYSDKKTYYGTKYRLDVVKYNGIYYIARIDAGNFSGIVPTDSSKWNPFGAQFESVATNLLLAEEASIGDWFIQGGKIVSTLTKNNEAWDVSGNFTGNVTGNKITLDAKKGQILLESNKTWAGELDKPDNAASVIDINVETGEIRAKNQKKLTTISANGIYSRNAKINILSSEDGGYHYAAVTGVIDNNLNFPRSDDLGRDLYRDLYIQAGVYGSKKGATGNAPAYGGYFWDLMASGLILKTKVFSKATTEILDAQYTQVVGIHDSGTVTLTLPRGDLQGRTIFVKQLQSGYMKIKPQGNNILQDDRSINTEYDVNEGWEYKFTFLDVQVVHKSITYKGIWVVSGFKFE